MPRFLRLALVLAGLVGLLAGGLWAQSTIHRVTEIYNFVNGLQIGGNPGLSSSSAALTVGGSALSGMALTTDSGSLAVDGDAALTSLGWRVTMPAAETVTAGATITADACGTLKRITAAGAVTTSTTDTFTAPAAANAGCHMLVCNVGSNTITLDNNAHFKSIGGADIALTADDCTQVVSSGASGAWYSVGSLVAN
jgi:uncharacterized phosphosugar-binding protein